MYQDPPFAVQIELVEGCSLSCDFCGINGIREKPGNFKYMTLENAEILATKFAEEMNIRSWNPRFEFAMHGEPSLHPNLCEILTIFRQAFGKKISMVMFSNGTGFLQDPNRIDHVLDAGINTIGLDNYEHVNIVPRLIEARHQAGLWTKVPVYYYPLQREHNLHSGRRVGHKDIVIIQDISKAETGNHSSLNTHCGGGMESKGGWLSARCAKPFRELAIRWDGNVAICCNDFRGIYKCGNAFDDQPIHALWNNAYFTAARKKLFARQRDFGPCQWCNAKSMRVGLLPDQKGLFPLSAPDREDQQLIDEACAGEPYTPPVLRSWELEKANLITPGTYPLNILDRKKLS